MFGRLRANKWRHLTAQQVWTVDKVSLAFVCNFVFPLQECGAKKVTIIEVSASKISLDFDGW